MNIPKTALHPIILHHTKNFRLCKPKVSTIVPVKFINQNYRLLPSHLVNALT